MIRFPAGKEPYHRALLFHAITALDYQRSRGKLRQVLHLDSTSFEVRSEFDDAETKKTLEAWVIAHSELLPLHTGLLMSTGVAYNKANCC